jgi:antitoxin (DNA-binding transcriptional repressor) of toxin-antitoxin stability system
MIRLETDKGQIHLQSRRFPVGSQPIHAVPPLRMTSLKAVRKTNSHQLFQLTKLPNRLYIDVTKTLTITDAKKNLSRWLDAGARGEDIGIIRGADIIALRKVAVESTDYAEREYGTGQEQIAAFEAAAKNLYRRLKRSGKLVTVTAEQLRKMLE